MPTTGGLRLALQAATRDDRCLRFAQVKLRTAGIEDALSLKLRFAEQSALPQQAIDQRSLAVVNVGDDGDIADVLVHWPGGSV